MGEVASTDPWMQVHGFSDIPCCEVMHLKLKKHGTLVLPQGSDPMPCCDCPSPQVLHHPVQVKLPMLHPCVTCPLGQS